MMLTHPFSPVLVEELVRREIHAVVGECIIEADASHAPCILKIIRDLELPLAITFNRSRLMILPLSSAKRQVFRRRCPYFVA